MKKIIALGVFVVALVLAFFINENKTYTDEKDYLRIWKYIDENILKWNLDKYYTS